MSKYVIFKTKDWDRLINGGHEFASELLKDLDDVSIDDAWVVRPQDAHAPTTLFAYANAIQTTIEILEEVRDDPPELNRLREIRDAAFEYAQTAQATRHHLPD